MTAIRPYDRVPDGSTFELTVRSEDDKAFAATARVLDDQGELTRWTFDADHPGQRSKILQSPRVYGVDLRIQFIAAEEVEVNFDARVVRSGGVVFSEPFTQTLVGTSGQEARRMVLLRTLKT